MTTNLTIKKVSQSNLPATDTNTSIIFTDNGKQYITLKDGKLLQVTDIIQVDSEQDLPSVKFANTFYFTKDTKEMSFYDGNDIHKLSVNIDEVKEFFLDGDGKIKDEFINEDSIVLKREYDAHVKGATHITAEERIKWNNKFSMPEAGLGRSDLSDELIELLLFKADLLDDNNKIKEEFLNSDILVLKREYDAHVKGATHITVEERIKWNKKYDLPETGIPKSDLDSEVKAKLDGALSEAKLKEHTDNADIHVTTAKKAEWDAKYLKPELGIPESDLTVEIKAKLEGNVKGTELFEDTDSGKKIKQTLLPNIDIDTEAIAEHVANKEIHVTKVNKEAWDTHKDNADIHVTKVEKEGWDAHKIDTDIHVTTAKKAEWDAKYLKPELGIPDSDLTAEVKAKLDGAVQSEFLLNEGKVKAELLPEGLDTTIINSHIGNGDIHVTKVNKEAWDTHKDNADIHVTKVEKEAWTGHKDNGDIHVTTEKKAEWDAKYLKPELGIPDSDLTAEVKAKLDGAVQSEFLLNEGKVKAELLPPGIDTTKFDTHIANSDIHVTKVEKEAWDAHKIDTDIHVTTEKKAEWDAKYLKPEDGIGLSDLDATVKEGVQGNVKSADLMDDEGKVKAELLPPGIDTTKFDTHIANSDIHVTTEKKAEWDAHKDNSDIHVTKVEKEAWTGHKDNADIHVTKVEKTAWDAHKDNSDIHVTTEKKAEWDAKYDKPELGIPKEHLKDDVLDHTNLKNIGIYSHADIDAHIENDIIHSNGALGRWDFEGSQFDTAQKTNISVPTESTHFELSKVSESQEYESEGNLVTTVFDTLIEACPFNAAFYFGSYDRSVHTIKIYTRTGSTPAYDRLTWNDWLLLDDEGRVKSASNRYIQLKIELLSADRFSTPQVKKVVVFYGRDVKDELKEAVGEYGSLSGRLDAMTALATHTNRDVLDKLTQDQLDKVDAIKSSYIKEITAPTTSVVISPSEHKLGKQDYDYEVRVFLKDSDNNVIPYMPKNWFVKESQITIEFSTDVPFVGRIVIK